MRWYHPVPLVLALLIVCSCTQTTPISTVEDYLSRGTILAKQGKPDEAISEFNKAIELDPDLFLAYVGRGAAYGDKQQWDQKTQVPEQDRGHHEAAVEDQPCPWVKALDQGFPLAIAPGYQHDST